MWKRLLFLTSVTLFATNNQTDTLSNISTDTSSLPFQITLSEASFELPTNGTKSTGLQTYAYGVVNNKILLLCGRTNGLHGFNTPSESFPVADQNTSAFVVDMDAQTVTTRALSHSSSLLTQAQIDTLSVTAPQFMQEGKTLYLIGGYGVDTASGTLGTKSTLTIIDVPKMIDWIEGNNNQSAAGAIRQVSHSSLQVTGGYLYRSNPHAPFLLMVGQNFSGYYSDTSNGVYTKQIRPFRIIDNGKSLYIKAEKFDAPDSNYRRRDLNILPIMNRQGKAIVGKYVVLSGVFTLASGVWTVPILVDPDGKSSMADPNESSTFKQGMSHYNCAQATLYSKSTNDNYMILFGGASYQTYNGSNFVQDDQIPFLNSVTTIKIDSNGTFSQFLMDNAYPTITSQFTNPGNTLLFGSEARFIPANNLPLFPNGVFSFDELGTSSTLLGYIIGGIQSTLANTNTKADSASSPYIFEVYIQRQ